MRTLSSVTLITCILTTLINLSSYFFHFAFSFILCIFLIFPLFVVAIAVFSEKLEINFNALSIILFIYAIATFFITTGLLDNFNVEKDGLKYVLNNRGTFIRDATIEEYRLYKSRSSRLVSAYVMFFFQILYITLKSSTPQLLSQVNEKQ